MYLSLCLCSFVVFSFYSAVLTSLMTLNDAGISINSFDDVIRLDLKMLSMATTAETNVLINSKPGTALHKVMGPFFLETVRVKSISDLLRTDGRPSQDPSSQYRSNC